MIIPGLVSATFKTESPDYVLDALQNVRRRTPVRLWRERPCS